MSTFAIIIIAIIGGVWAYSKALKNNNSENEAETREKTSEMSGEKRTGKIGDIIKERDCLHNYWGSFDYVGKTKNGIPHGHGGIYDSRSMSPYPIEEGEYVNGKLVSGRIYNADGDSYVYSASDHDASGRRNGYGTGFDSNGKLYTGKWINGYTEDEWDELMHDIN